jgi:SpoVK/Ycf46/Vps4 family AAA+-type ATPase
MFDDSTQDWTEVNQKYLMAALDRVRIALESHLGETALENSVSLEMPENVSAALEMLCAVFGLSPFERDILLLCAGMELDSKVIALCANAQGDSRRPYPTFSLALAALPDPHWSAIVPTSPLRYWRLIEIGRGETLTSSSLRIDERILHYLAGVSHLDERLMGLVEPLAAPDGLPPSHDNLVRQLVNHLCPSENRGAVVQLCGQAGDGSHAIAAAACAEVGLHLQLLRARNIPASTADRETFMRIWEREAIITNSALLLDCHEMETPEAIKQAVAFVEQIQTPVFVALREPLQTARRCLLRIDINKPYSQEQLEIWQRLLGEQASKLNGQLPALVTQFCMHPQEIANAGATVFNAQPIAENLYETLWDACRAQSRVRLDDLAQRLLPAADWDDLVLPKLQKQILQQIVTHVRQRAKVYDDWGFAMRCNRGLGISALFGGASGTGKTMAAEVLADALQLDLYRIDLSAVVSKYIGETEKNLRRVFDAAESSGAVLLFDEADALFGKRSEVKDSHDRYANIEVSYLLQRMESYRGLAILTTNMKKALDPAFMRRIRFVVHFPFPDASQRAEIWKRIFPAQTPTQGLNIERLAQLNVTGGNIRNIALSAAFLAADEDSPVRMRHLLQASQGEYAKLERPLTGAEVGGWV